jgi:hypothetical protein
MTKKSQDGGSRYTTRPHPEVRALARLEGWLRAHAEQHPSRLAEDGSHLRMTAVLGMDM